MSQSLIKRPFQYRFYNASLYLIAANVVVFFITYLSPSVIRYLWLYPVAVQQANAYWQFVTYMFAHANISHILFNMLGLFFFGVHVERSLGSTEFLVFYMVTGVLAGVFSYFIFVATGVFSPLLGASGAVYAVLLAYATLFPDSMIYLMGIIPIRAPILVLGFTALAVFSQLFNLNSGVAHLTHLAGFGFAFFYFLVRLDINPIRVFFGNDRTFRR